MSNIQVVQAAFIQRKVQKECKRTGRDWLEIIAEEIEKIRNEKGVRKLKRTEMLERHTKAIAFCKENIKLSKAETIERLVEEFGYASKTAYDILREEETEKVRKNSRTKRASESLKAYLDRLEVEEQKAYERKMLEEELNRPKFFF